MTLPTSDYTTINKIYTFLDQIKSNPKRDVNYFFFDENKKFIVYGNKLKSLPMPWCKYYTNEEFYVHVDAINRRIQFYAFDIKDYITGERVNEATGIIEWSKEIEDIIYNFFVLNIKELSNATYPYSNVETNKSSKTQQTAYTAPYTPPQNTYTQSDYNNHGYYGSPAYKEREAFFDKVNDLLKYNKTAQATDFVFDKLNKMIEEKKTSIIDDIFRVIAFDKLNIPVMVSILEATKNIEGLKERDYFLGKVKTHLQKLKPSRANMVLKRAA